MKKKPTSSTSVSLLQVGMLLIVAGPLANIATGFVLSPPTNSAAARGQAFGSGLVAVLAVVAGVVLIAIHFARRRR